MKDDHILFVQVVKLSSYFYENIVFEQKNFFEIFLI